MRLELHRHWILTAVAVCFLSLSPSHSTPAKETEAQATEGQAAEAKVKVGQTAPGFKLQDQNGRTVRLKDLIGDRPTAVVFHRSADW